MNELEQLDVGHLGGVYDAAFSPDGELLATSAWDGYILLWDLRTGRMRRRLPAGDGPADSLVFSPDGATLVAAHRGLERWEVRSCRRLDPVPELQGPAAFVGPGRLLGTDHERLILLDLESGRIIRELPIGHPKSRSRIQVAISADGSTAATAEERSTRAGETRFEIRIWDLRKWEPRTRRTLGGRLEWTELDVSGGGTPHCIVSSVSQIDSLELSPDGSWLLVVCSACLLLSTAARSTARWVLPEIPSMIPRAGRFSADGRQVAVIADSRDGAWVRLWSVPDCRPGRVFRADREYAWALTFSPDGRSLLVGGTEKVVRLWDVASGALCRRLRAMEYETTAVAWSHDGRWVATGYSDRQVRFWDGSTGALAGRLPVHRGEIEQVLFLPEGTPAPPTCPQAVLFRTDYGDMLVVERQVRHAEEGEVLRALSVDGVLEAVSRGTRDQRRIEVRRTDTGDVIRTFRLVDHHIPKCLCFSSDGALIATGDYDNGVWLWDLRTGERVPPVVPREGDSFYLYTPSPAASVAFSPDGRFLLVGSWGGEVWIWDLVKPGEQDPWENGGTDHVLKGHAARVRSIAFSPDGRRLATVGDDATVRLWNTGTWELLKTLLVLPTEENQPSEEWAALPGGREGVE